MIDVPPQSLAIIRNIIKKHIPRYEVRAFGSRTLGMTKPYSDLDLALLGPGQMAASTLAALQEDFQESDLPFRVDLVDWHALSPEFQAVIAKHYEILQSAI